jgi:NAD(P)H-quinone oxidoreductase subunit 6
MRFCYTRRGFTTRSSSRSAFVSTTIVAFYLLAAFTVASALGVALSHNIVYSAFALMGALLGTAGVFVLLGADFLGVVQLLVYVGGILVLSLFAIMLTHRIADVRVSNRSVGRGVGAVLVGAVLIALVRVALRATWIDKGPGAPVPTTYGVGNAFLTDFALPFEIASLVLLVALIGAVTVSRKEIKG